MQLQVFVVFFSILLSDNLVLAKRKCPPKTNQLAVIDAPKMPPPAAPVTAAPITPPVTPPVTPPAVVDPAPKYVPAVNTSTLGAIDTTPKPTPPAPKVLLASEIDLQIAYKQTLEGVQRVIGLQGQYGNMPDTVAGATQLLAEIKILTKPGLTQDEFDACTERLLKLKADGDAKEKAKKAEAKRNLGKVLRELKAAKKDRKENGPRPNMNPALQQLQALIKK